MRDYPKIVERLKGQLAKWQASEKRTWMLGQVGYWHPTSTFGPEPRLLHMCMLFAVAGWQIRRRYR